MTANTGPKPPEYKPKYGPKPKLCGFDSREKLIDYVTTLYTGGVQQKEIARLLGVSRSFVCSIVKESKAAKPVRIIRFV